MLFRTKYSSVLHNHPGDRPSISGCARATLAQRVFTVSRGLFWFAVVGLTSSAAAQAGPVAIGLTGWNQDVVAESTAANPTAGTTTGVAGWAFYQHGAPGSSQGLPANGSLTSTLNPAVTFQLQPYTGNNVILQNGSLTLNTPGAFSSLEFLTSAQGTDSVQVTLNFSDNSTASFSINDQDWVIGSSADAATNVGLVSRGSSWSGFYNSPVYLYEHDYTVPTIDSSKTLNSISFSSAVGNEMIFAVDGIAGTAAVPEPGTLSLLLGGVAGCIALRYRRQGRVADCTPTGSGIDRIRIRSEISVPSPAGSTAAG